MLILVSLFLFWNEFFFFMMSINLFLISFFIMIRNLMLVYIHGDKYLQNNTTCNPTYCNGKTLEIFQWFRLFHKNEYEISSCHVHIIFIFFRMKKKFSVLLMVSSFQKIILRFSSNYIVFLLLICSIYIYICDTILH